MKKSLDEASELDGYDDLKPEDKKKIDKTWEDGHVADEDIPESAKKPAGEDGEEEKPKRKKAAPKKTDEEGGEKPKRARPTKAKVIRTATYVLRSNLMVSQKVDDEETDGDEERKPQKTAPTRKPRSKVRQCMCFGYQN